MRQICSYESFFPPYFSCPFCRFSTFVFFAVFFYFLYYFTKKAHTVCAKAEASIFLGSLAKQSKKLLNCWLKCERYKWTSGLGKTLEDKPRSVWPSFFKCVRNVIEKPVSICVIILQDRKVKKTSTSQYQSFEHNGEKIYDQQRLESLEEERASHM